MNQTITMPEWMRSQTDHPLSTREIAVIARDLQQLRLSNQCPEVDGFDINTFCKPLNSVGGDYLDFLWVGGNKLAIVVGDVVGKGTGGAVIMSMVRNAIRACILHKYTPVDILCELNDFVFRYTTPDIFVTVFLSILDTSKQSISMARAGHEPVIFLPVGEESCHILKPRGMALGIDGGEIFSEYLEQVDISLSPGDSFLFYTDGITEAMDNRGEMFSIERLAESTAESSSCKNGDVLNYVYTYLRKFISNSPQRDDQTMVSLVVKT